MNTINPGSCALVLVSAEMVAFERLRSCDHPKFKALLPMLRDGPVHGTQQDANA